MTHSSSGKRSFIQLSCCLVKACLIRSDEYHLLDGMFIEPKNDSSTIHQLLVILSSVADAVLVFLLGRVVSFLGAMWGDLIRSYLCNNARIGSKAPQNRQRPGSLTVSEVKNHKVKKMQNLASENVYKKLPGEIQ